jgi:formylglycine-generating enzyme required for sulfatase activity
MLIEQLKAETDASARRALILGLGEYGPEQLPGPVRREVTALLLRWYRDDPDAGVHGAIDWLLRHGQEGPDRRKLDWDQAKTLGQIDADLAGKPREGRRWSVAPLGLTMIECPKPGVFQMGSPPAETERSKDETQHPRCLPRSFAIASKPVTVRQLQQFLKENPEVEKEYSKQYAPDLDCPMINVSWYVAAQYCRWLSDKEGLPDADMCYPTIAEIQKSKEDSATPLKLPANYLQRKSYRLPTEAEWEYACRARTETSRSHGVGLDLLPRYAWYARNSSGRSWPVGQKRPNDFGLFDMHGNVWSWCQDRAVSYPEPEEGKPVPDQEDKTDIRDITSRSVRGGSFVDLPPNVRSACRSGARPVVADYVVGFRPARTSYD